MNIYALAQYLTSGSWERAQRDTKLIQTDSNAIIKI